MPPKEEILALIKKECGLDATLVDANPQIIKEISLLPLGSVGKIVVYKADDGSTKAVLAPWFPPHELFADAA